MELRWHPSTDQPFRRSYTIEWVAIGFLERNNRGSRRGQTVDNALTNRQSRAADARSDKYPKVVPTLNQAHHHWHEERNVPTALEHRSQNMRRPFHAATLPSLKPGAQARISLCEIPRFSHRDAGAAVATT